MIFRWNIVTLILLSLQLVYAMPSNDKEETIPEGSRIFVVPGENSYEQDVHSRHRRVGIDPTEKPEKPEKSDKSDKSETPMMAKDTPKKTGLTTTKNLASEARDMEETSVKPHDDDDVDNSTTVKAAVNSSQSSAVPDAKSNQTDAPELEDKKVEVTTITSTTTAKAINTVASDNSTANCPGLNVTLGILKTDSKCPPIDFPATGNETIDDVSPEMRHKLKYNTSSDLENNATEAPVVFKPVIDIHTLPPSTAESTTEKSQVKETRQEILERSQEIKLEEQKDNELPGGIVALIIALTFAVFAVSGYVGLTVRRRYLEYRQGNRELLVNDFDSSDINNFEL